MATYYYMKLDAVTSTLTGTADFVTGSTTVTGTGTLFSTELQVGDYIRPASGVQWYKVTAIASDTSCTISPAYQQTPDALGASIEQNRGDGSTANPFCSVYQYTTDTVRSPDDALYVQLGETHKVGARDVAFDEDGTSAAPIKIVGSDWKGTGATANAIFDFDGTTEQFLATVDDFWRFENIDIINNADELFYSFSSAGLKFANCSIHGGADGIYIDAGTNGVIEINSCTFYDNTVYSFNLIHGHAIIKDSTFNGGAATTDVGVSSRGYTEIINSSFGQTTSHDLYDLRCDGAGKIICRGCLFSEAKTVVTDPGGYIKSYDHQQVKGAFWSKYYQGTIEKDTVEVRTGGASSCIKVTPNSNISENYPLQCLDNWMIDDVTGGVSHTATVYVKSKGIVSTFPTNTQLYLEVEYYDAATGTTRATKQSLEELTADNTYTALTVTFTPGQDGPITARLYIGYYEGGEVYYIDNQLDLT